MSNDYVPRNEQELAAWAAAYRQQISQQSGRLDLSGNQVATVQQAIDTFLADLSDSEIQTDTYHASIAKKDGSKAIMLNALRMQANVVKNSPNYTDAVGALLGIIGQEVKVIDTNTLKPMPKIGKTVQGVFINYVKKRMDGVLLYSRRAGETAFTLLDKFTRNVCEDKRPNLNNAPAELREYYLVYFKKDQPIGQASDITNITV